MFWRVTSCSCGASVSDAIGASVFVVDANKEESIQVASMNYYYNHHHHHHHHHHHRRQLSTTHQLYGVYQ
jgi:hypothetical protein